MYTAKGRLDIDSMLRQYSPLVRRLAHQMIAKLPANVELDDLIQVGLIGLTDALSRFDVKVIAITGAQGDRNFLDVAKLFGARRTFEKPFDLKQLVQAVKEELAR